MKYLPIMEELFSSDLIYIVLIGIGAAIIFSSFTLSYPIRNVYPQCQALP